MRLNRGGRSAESGRATSFWSYSFIETSTFSRSAKLFDCPTYEGINSVNNIDNKSETKTTARNSRSSSSYAPRFLNSPRGSSRSFNGFDHSSGARPTFGGSANLLALDKEAHTLRRRLRTVGARQSRSVKTANRGRR